MNRRLLRTIGIAIIVFLPDPTFISDVIGLLLVGVSYFVPRGGKFSYNRLNGLVQYYLGNTKGGEFKNFPVAQRALILSPKYGRAGSSSDPDEAWRGSLATGQVRYHTLNRRRPVVCHRVGSFNPEKQQYCWHQKAETEKLIHHMLNRV